MIRLIWFELIKTFTRWRTYIGFIAFGIVVADGSDRTETGRAGFF